MSTYQTPILDLEQPLPTRKGYLVAFVEELSGFIGVMIAMWVVPFVVAGSIAAGPSVLDGWLSNLEHYGIANFFSVVLAIWYLCLVTHELGHLLVGRLIGFRMRQLALGPLVITNVADRTKATLARRWDFVTFMTIGAPTKLRRRLCVYSMGGILANLLCGSISLVLVSSEQTLSNLALAEIAFYSVWYIVITAIPYTRRNGLVTDGFRLLSFVRSDPSMKRWLAITELSHNLDCGIRGKRWSRELVNAAGAGPQGSLDALQGGWLAYYATSDAHEIESSARYLEQCLHESALAKPEFKQALILEASVFQAWERKDIQKANQWRMRIDHSVKVSPILLERGSIALLWAEGKTDEATQRWQTAIASIQALPVSPVRKLMEESFLEWREEMNMRLQSQATR